MSLFRNSRELQGIAENCNLGHVGCGKSIGKSEGQRRRTFSYRGKRMLKGAVINEESMGRNQEFKI